MANAIDTYSTGTVSVANGDTEIVGVGTDWWPSTRFSRVKPGDTIVIGQNAVMIVNVVDNTHLTILPWPFTSVSAGTAYTILQAGITRIVGSDPMLSVSSMIDRIDDRGFFVYVAPDRDAPDPSLGDVGQWAIQSSTKKLWELVAGAGPLGSAGWVFRGLFAGFVPAGDWDVDTDYKVGHTVTLDGASYVAVQDNTGQMPPNATYWQVLAEKGDTGTISVGTVTTGAPGTDAEVTNVGTSGAAVFDFTIPQEEPGAGDVTAANKLSEYTSVAADALANLNGVSYGAAQSLSSGQKAQAASNIFKGPTAQKFLSGSGTYTTPANCLWIRVVAVGGGGGGGGGGATPTVGGNGGNTTFGLHTAGGGGGASNSGAGGTGGSFTIGAGAIGFGSYGNGGGGTVNQVAVNMAVGGGDGGGSALGGGGSAPAYSSNGIAGMTNTGGGGSGGGSNNVVGSQCGSGGGGGGFLDIKIVGPASTYSYAVGAGGAAGTSGGQTLGGGGGSGLIVVEEYYGS